MTAGYGAGDGVPGQGADETADQGLAEPPVSGRPGPLPPRMVRPAGHAPVPGPAGFPAPPGGGLPAPAAASVPPPPGGFAAPPPAGFGTPSLPDSGFTTPSVPDGGLGTPPAPAAGFGTPSVSDGGLGTPPAPHGGFGTSDKPGSAGFPPHRDPASSPDVGAAPAPEPPGAALPGALGQPVVPAPRGTWSPAPNSGQWEAAAGAPAAPRAQAGWPPAAAPELAPAPGQPTGFAPMSGQPTGASLAPGHATGFAPASGQPAGAAPVSGQPTASPATFGQPTSAPAYPAQPTSGPGFPAQPTTGPGYPGQPTSGPAYPGQPVSAPVHSGQSLAAAAYPGQPGGGTALPGQPASGPAYPADPAARRRRLPVVALALAGVLAVVAGVQAYQIHRLDDRLAATDRRLADVQGAAGTRFDGLEQRTGALEKQAGAAFNPEAVASAVLPSVFRVRAGDFTGTAFAVGKPPAGGGTTLLTNFHVVESVFAGGGRKVFLERSDQRFEATIVRVDKDKDIAQLSTSARFKALVAAATPVKSGQQIVVVGAPLGLQDTVTTGVVSAFRKDDGDSGPVIQFDAPINPGNSGGPVINGAKEVVGIATAKARDAEGIGLAVPIKTACDTFSLC
ncbi:trypsin-like peptidase domain-containing protein [Micromonospora sp. NPDC048930]|uniref:S1C family serine protease n=1 Tax=Micromonospora sp. NPDC048930 TaxID=3364261 RepID=UPI0037137705